MKCIVSPFARCFENIGSEEYYLSNFEEDIFYLYINSPCIVVGKHQNTSSEINQSYVNKNQIDVVRRMSGGGAVYHDHGNLNFGFITQNKGNDIDAVFREFTLPILNVLKKLGVQAEFSGRNDLVIKDMKISGVAQYHTSTRVLLHGTLLFNSDLSKVSDSLNADPRKFQDKSVKSIRSRVSNISPFLSQPLNIEEFTSIIIKEVLSEFSGSSLYELSELDIEQIEKLAHGKYSTWEWVYGNSPKFTYQGELKYEKGILDIGLNVQAGVIRQVSIFGDFFGKKEVEELKIKLMNVNYQRNAVEAALAGINLDDYIFGLTKDAFIESLFSNAL
ncbi:MAG: lipoate--protein ligase [Eubacteriales bacterium]